MDSFNLALRFLNNLKKGDSFMIYNVKWNVINIGNWQSKIFTKKNKTIQIKSETGINIKFYSLNNSYHGNPASISKNAHSKQYNLIRDIEGIIIVDLLNEKNVLHTKSDLIKIAQR